MKTKLQPIDDGQGVLIPKSFLEGCGITDEVNIRLENNRIVLEPVKSKTERPERFVDRMFELCNSENKAAKARLKRADSDNPKIAEQSYEYLAHFYIELDRDYEYRPYATIAAAIAKSKVERNGNIGIGRAIALCYEDGNASDQAKAKLRRLLACESVDEVCRILRPLFSLIEAKASVNLNYTQLLSDLLYFHSNPQRVKSRWAQDFYQRSNTEEVA
jgi:CRISPR system Cascade subunit CasB